MSQLTDVFSQRKENNLKTNKERTEQVKEGQKVLKERGIA